jgi:hypothetical protein
MSERLCIVTDCKKVSDTRNMCPMHYARLLRHGNASISLSNRQHKVCIDYVSKFEHRWVMEEHLGQL